MEMKIVVQIFYRPDPHTMPDGFSRRQVVAGLYLDENGELTDDQSQARIHESYMDAAAVVEGVEALSMVAFPDEAMEIDKIVLENIA